MDLMTLPTAGWATVIALALALAGAVLARNWTRTDKQEKKHEDELEAAEKEMREANRVRDPDRWRLAAERLHRAREGKT